MTQDHPAVAEFCLNCGARAPGHYCQDCGQHTRLHVPSATEFLHEFIGHYVALEGKLWGTVRRLLCHPGALTNDYIAGRRVRYVEPLRIYLTFSILFFALFKLPGHELVRSTGQPPVAAAVGAHVRDGAAPAQPGGADKGPVADQPADASAPPATPPPATLHDGSAALIDATGKAAPWLVPRLRHLQTLSTAETITLAGEGFLHFAPYAMFLLLPVFALYLKLLYLGSGRRYGEHFLFALHSNGFGFLAFGLILLAPFDIVQLLLFCWMVAYLPWAMRRVYGGTKRATLARWITLMALYLLTMLAAMVVVLALAVLH